MGQVKLGHKYFTFCGSGHVRLPDMQLTFFTVVWKSENTQFLPLWVVGYWQRRKHFMILKYFVKKKGRVELSYKV